MHYKSSPELNNSQGGLNGRHTEDKYEQKVGGKVRQNKNVYTKTMKHQLMSYLRESSPFFPLHWCRCHLSFTSIFAHTSPRTNHWYIIRLLLILISSPLSICTIDNYTRIQFNDCAICCYKQENSHRWKKRMVKKNHS